MSGTVPVLKDEERAHPVPSRWRATIGAIVEALAGGRYDLDHLADVEPLDERTATQVAEAVADYGCTLVSLPEDSWVTSICQWQVGFWQVMVDLFTAEEGRSDLVLHVNVFERPSGHLFRVHLVYVP